MAEQQKERLASWKEIAAFLGRDVTTVQRWERELGLPIRRADGRKGHSVYAYPEEINRWLERRSVAANGQSFEKVPEKGNGNGTAKPLNLLKQTAIRPSHLHRAAPVVLVVSSVILVCAVAVYIVRATRPPQIARLAFTDTGLAAWDASPKLLWAYDFGERLGINPSTEVFPPIVRTRWTENAPEEILVVPPLAISDQDLSTDTLYSFSTGGKLLWSHRFDDRLSFAGTVYGPRWLFGALMTISDDPNPSIWCAVREFPWFPSVVLEMDKNGHPLARFVNAGHIIGLFHIRNHDGSFVLASGINNEYGSAMLAVLREESPSGSSPQTPGSHYSCDDCPEGQPYRYFVFPRSELNRASTYGYNQTWNVLVDKSEIHVMVDELAGTGTPDWESYNFTAGLQPVSVEVSDHYWVDHRQFYAQGKIKHSVEDCPERTQPHTIREWDPENGWREFKVPIIASKDGSHEVSR